MTEATVTKVVGAVYCAFATMLSEEGLALMNDTLLFAAVTGSPEVECASQQWGQTGAAQRKRDFINVHNTSANAPEPITKAPRNAHTANSLRLSRVLSQNVGLGTLRKNFLNRASSYRPKRNLSSCLPTETTSPSGYKFSELCSKFLDG
jgi:hypothetical protein